jgi:uncharacterized membrane protein
MAKTWAITDDIATWVVIATGLLLVAAVMLLVQELAQRQRRSWLIFGSGLLAALSVSFAVVRPVVVEAQANMVGPRVVALVDQSRRLRIPTEDGTRAQRAARSLDAVTKHFADSRLSVLGFSEGALAPLASRAEHTTLETSGARSDLVAAIRDLAETPGERPRSVIVISDGRLSRPASGADAEALRQAVGTLGVPIHTVSLLDEDPPDASIRSVRAAGVAVAHQPLAVTVEVGCAGELECERVPVRIRELRDGVAPADLASGVAEIKGGVGTVELELTLDRAGGRVIEVALEPPKGDEIRENDTRYLTFFVARDRIRLLHLAGRPTYDVRALRRWLKSDESVDVVAFFILRGDTDTPHASANELALIRFPVDELFSEHLPSFDAVILQDIDAERYKLDQYLPRLARYVEIGGGLIMVGGPSSFAGGSYAGTPLDSILPVEQPRSREAFDATPFVPQYTAAGHAAAVTRPLRALLGDNLPPMAGTNYLGQSRPGAIVLWEHPSIRHGAQPMPVLALGEAGDGRAIALSVDSTHRLGFGKLASEVGGRAYGALWDGLLGWLMRDPRYEAARVDLVGECIESESDTKLRLTRLPGMEGKVVLSLLPLTPGAKEAVVQEVPADELGPLEISVKGLKAGGYTARARIGAAPPSRHDFACEHEGVAWADSRPDPARLAAISAATGGKSVDIDHVAELPLPDPTRISSQRKVSPLAPPWVWTLASACLLGLHWVVRRNSGLP